MTDSMRMSDPVGLDDFRVQFFEGRVYVALSLLDFDVDENGSVVPVQVELSHEQARDLGIDLMDRAVRAEAVGSPRPPYKPPVS